MNQLFLEDLSNMTDAEVRSHLISEYGVTIEQLEKFDILLGYESVGSWGCDSSSYFLMRRKEDGVLFENSASHCSCCGFEDQFEPAEATIEYLQSDKFYVSLGGYDNMPSENEAAIKSYMKSL